MTPIEVLRLLAPEFSSISDEVITQWIELFTPFVSAKRFGDTYNQALALLTAHKLKMAGYGDNTNGTIGDTLRVGSYSEGETSIGYTVNQGTNLLNDAELTLTTYGLQYLSLRRARIIPIVSAGEA
ncbi:DUF4054 domain-containing protein [Calorimonas adulescens]|uniref:DUF4054 domain-containing protein n=1 Tax=Calorimonas adulescens TaxID=2606906 RepID=A0A5D8QGB4_9THEO|nr:DUF4054 domain-containing protein [Calorimonas adulescens]TZE83541.1 DUF4054 domain-containing protein [Calorimonas adulescens]